jgi:hypothetical protein
LFSVVPSRYATSPVFSRMPAPLPVAPGKPLTQPISKPVTPPLKSLDHSVFRSFQAQQGSKEAALSNINAPSATDAPSSTDAKAVPAKVIFPFTYTPDVIVKNSAILHPEEVEHALEEILGKDFRKTQKELEIEKARAARLEAKRLKKLHLKKLQKKKKMSQGQDPVEHITKAEKSVATHFQGWA